MAGPFQTPYDNHQPVPSTDGSNVARRGGYELPDGQKATENLSELPNAPDTFSVPDGPGEGAQIPVGEIKPGRRVD